MSFLALHIDPMGHVKDSYLFSGWGGEFGKFGQALGHYGFTKQIALYALAGLLTVTIFLLRARRVRTEQVPRGFGNMLEVVMLYIRDNVARPFLGDHCEKFLPFLWSLFFFILISNLLGLVPLFDYLGHGGNTPTGSIFLTAALALSAFVIYHTLGVIEQGHGIWGYIKSLFPHVPVVILPIIVPVELIGVIVKPCALAIRLFANMLAGHVMLATIIAFTGVWTTLIHWGAGISLVVYLGCVALTFLELMVALIQAFVFTFLTTVFLAAAVHPEH